MAAILQKRAMAEAKPNISPLEAALQRLKEGLADYGKNPDYDLIRDGLIKRFEFTYGTACKILARYLEYASAGNDEVRQMSFPTLIRTANEHNLLQGDWSDWKEFRDMRNKTSHTYDLAIAKQVVEGIPRFIEEADWLCHKLRKNLQ